MLIEKSTEKKIGRLIELTNKYEAWSSKRN